MYQGLYENRNFSRICLSFTNNFPIYRVRASGALSKARKFTATQSSRFARKCCTISGEGYIFQKNHEIVFIMRFYVMLGGPV